MLVDEEDISRIRAYGEGLTNVRLHQTTSFDVDTAGLYGSKITADLRGMVFLLLSYGHTRCN